LTAMGEACSEMHQMAHALMKRVDTMSLGSLIEPPDQAAQAGIMSTQNPENSATPRTKNLMNAVAVVSQLLEGVENQKLSNEACRWHSLTHRINRPETRHAVSMLCMPAQHLLKLHK